MSVESATFISEARSSYFRKFIMLLIIIYLYQITWIIELDMVMMTDPDVEKIYL